MIVTSQADEVEENSEQCSFEYAVKVNIFPTLLGWRCNLI